MADEKNLIETEKKTDRRRAVCFWKVWQSSGPTARLKGAREPSIVVGRLLGRRL